MPFIGNDNTGASGGNATINFRWVIPADVDAPDGGTIDYLELYCAGTGAGTGDQVFRGCVYSDTAGPLPNTLMGSAGSEVTVVDGAALAWCRSTFTPIDVDPGTTRVWLGIIAGANTQTIAFRFTAAASGANRFIADTYADGPAAAAGSMTAGTQAMSIRALFTPAASTSAGLLLLGVQ